MNIAFVNATKKWGGVKTWQLDFAQILAGGGHTVRFYGRQPAFVEAAKRRVGHGRQVRFGADCNPMTVSFFYKEFKRESIDIVVLNIGKDLATAGVAARLLGIPVVQRIGMPGDIPLRWKTRMLHKFINPWFLCPCEYIRRGFLQQLPYILPERTHMILNGKRVATHVLQPKHPRILVATQQLNKDKGHEDLFRALAQQQAPYTLHVAGTGDYEDYLRTLARDLGIDKHIVWHGFVSDVPALLVKADIFLLGSLAEGLPNTLLEALAAGLLPIIRDVGGVKEVLTDPLLPWVVPFNAKETEFAALLEKALALSDNDLLTLQGQARTACIERCEITRQAAMLEAWLLGLLGKR